MNPITLEQINLYGETGKLAEKIVDHWLLGLRETNPEILDKLVLDSVKYFKEREEEVLSL